MDEAFRPLDPKRSYGIAPFRKGRMSRRAYVRWLEENLWRPSRIPGLTVPADISPAAWIGDRLTPGSFEVHMMVPDGFEAYARIFFPFVRDAVLHDGSPHDATLTWTEVAALNGRTAHALMEAETISPTNQAQGRRSGLYTCLSPPQEEALWPILEGHSTTHDGWFLLWDGFGGLDPRPFESQPKVEHRGRSYHLLHGPLTAHTGFADAPSYIWPEDRAWCLVTDIDFQWAYIAGTSACVNDIVATPVLDAYATKPSNPAGSGMDTVNDPHRTIPRDC